MFDSIKKINDGIQEMLDPVNPFTSDINKYRTKEGLKLLVKAGFSKDDIKQLIDVSRAQADPFIDEEIMREEIRKEIVEEKRTRTKRSA